MAHQSDMMWPMDVQAMALSALTFRSIPTTHNFRPIRNHNPNSGEEPDYELCENWIAKFESIRTLIQHDHHLVALVHGLKISTQFSELLWLLTTMHASTSLCGRPVSAAWSAERCRKLLVAAQHVAQNIQDMGDMVVTLAVRTWGEPFSQAIRDQASSSTSDGSSHVSAEQSAPSSRAAASRAGQSLANSQVCVGIDTDRLVRLLPEGMRPIVERARQGGGSVGDVLRRLTQDEREAIRPHLLEATVTVAAENTARRLNLPPNTIDSLKNTLRAAVAKELA